MRRALAAALTCGLAAATAATATVSVERSQPFPTYYVGDAAAITVSTEPPQPYAEVYVWRRLDGEWIAEGAPLGTTDANGQWTNSVDPLPTEAVGSYSDEQFAVGEVTGPRSAPMAFEIRALPAAPMVLRPPPFPDYQAGGGAELLISTDPPEPFQPVFRWLMRGGVVVEAGVEIGFTDAAGGLYRLVDPLPESAVGSYSDERFAVARVTAQRSAPLGYTIHPPMPIAAPQVTLMPAPLYRVGDTLRFDLATDPAQVGAGVFLWRHRGGVAVDVGTSVGTTGVQGTAVVLENLVEMHVGDYTEVRFAVGGVDNPRSAALSYSVLPALVTTPPTVTRGGAFPHYRVGGSAELEVSTDPPQPHATVYTWKRKDGVQIASGVPIGTTGADGRFSNQVSPLPASAIGHYTFEQFAVGDVANPRSTSLSYWIHEENSSRMVSFSVAHHAFATIGNGHVDELLGWATDALQTDDGHADVACDVTFSRQGDVAPFRWDGPAVVNTDSDYQAVQAEAADVKVVLELNYCTGFLPGLAGCAAGNGFLVIRYSGAAMLEGNLWAHEHGHDVGLGHSFDPQAVMFRSAGSDRRKVVQEECDRFLFY